MAHVHGPVAPAMRGIGHDYGLTPTPKFRARNVVLSTGCKIGRAFSSKFECIGQSFKRTGDRTAKLGASAQGKQEMRYNHAHESFSRQVNKLVDDLGADAAKLQAGDPKALQGVLYRLGKLEQQATVMGQNNPAFAGSAAIITAQVDRAMGKLAQTNPGAVVALHQTLTQLGMTVDNAILAKGALSPADQQMLADLNVLKGAVQANVPVALQQILQRKDNALPQGLNLQPTSNHVSQMQGTLAGNGRDFIDASLGGVLARPVRAEVGMPTVSDQFMLDVNRSTVKLVDGANQTTISNTGADPRPPLRQFGGTDNITQNLSHYLNQEIPVSMGVAFSLEHTNSSGQMVALGPSDFNVEYTVTKDPNGDFLIDYKYSGHIDNFNDGANRMVADGPNSPFQMTMQIKVTASDLENGVNTFAVTQAPAFDLHFKPDWAANA